MWTTSGVLMAKKKTKKVAKKKPAVKAARKATKRVVGRPFVKGQSGNPAGAPKGWNKQRDLLFQALHEVEKEKKKTLMRHACEKAFVSEKVLIALLKKILPDMTHIEGDAGLSLTDIMALIQGTKK